MTLFYFSIKKAAFFLHDNSCPNIIIALQTQQSSCCVSNFSLMYWRIIANGMKSVVHEQLDAIQCTSHYQCYSVLKANIWWPRKIETSIILTVGLTLRVWYVKRSSLQRNYCDHTALIVRPAALTSLLWGLLL